MAFLDEAGKNYSYVEIDHLRNMKGIGCSNIRTENFAIRRHGRKWLHFPVLGMRAGFPRKSPCKGNSTSQDHWVLGVCAHRHMPFPASECLCSSLKGSSQASPLFWVLFSDICTTMNFSFSSSTLVATGITQHSNFYMSVSSTRHSLSYSSLCPNSLDTHWYTVNA